jgi:hypothetical protein
VKDTLYVLRPGFDDGGARYFCPYCAQVTGYLTYFPEVRDTLEIIELDFARPRRALVDLIGEANQSAPKLVLADGAQAIDAPGVEISLANGRRFVANTAAILRYLALTRGTPLPH